MRVNGRRLAALLAVVALLLVVAESPVSAQTDRGAYTITGFDTTIEVEADSNVVVEERIAVNFSEPRHGIFRTIPVAYSDPHGYAYSFHLQLLGVADGEGRRQQTQVSRGGRNTTIRIGDPDRTVNGDVTYVIRYRVRDALGQFRDHDEIYWNATGTEWNASIDHASATVRLPQPLGPSDLTAAGYTGAFGSRGRDVEISYPEPGVVRFVATRRLDRLEGLTVAVGFPQGVVTFPTGLDRAARLAADNWVALLPVGWLVFLIGRFRERGRDPDPDAPIVVTYEPPPGMTPGGIGTVIDERVDLADITATVVDLAVRRHLTIRTEERDRLFGLLSRDETVFVKEANTTDPLLPHEKAVLDGIFATGDRVDVSDLTNKFYRRIPAIRSALYERLVAEGYFEQSPEDTRQRWLLGGVLASFGTGLAAAGWLFFRGIPPPAVVVIPVVAGVLTMVLFALFSRAMPRRTARGVKARQWALGFQEFAQRVEGDRLERAAADPRRAFETLLPYAMALGVASDWAKKFEGIYAQSGPVWYGGTTTGHAFSTVSLERSLSTAMSQAGRSMASSPRSSSGSGGGGSSGGGGGGGGGGSW